MLVILACVCVSVCEHVCVCSHGLEQSGDNGLWGLSGAVMCRFRGLLGCQATGTQGLRALKTTVSRGSPGCDLIGSHTGLWGPWRRSRGQGPPVQVPGWCSAPAWPRGYSLPPSRFTLCLNILTGYCVLQSFALETDSQQEGFVGKPFWGSLRPSPAPQILQAKSEAGLKWSGASRRSQPSILCATITHRF